jgi:hypothetical protein
MNRGECYRPKCRELGRQVIPRAGMCMGFFCFEHASEAAKHIEDPAPRIVWMIDKNHVFREAAP